MIVVHIWQLTHTHGYVAAPYVLRGQVILSRGSGSGPQALKLPTAALHTHLSGDLESQSRILHPTGL